MIVAIGVNENNMTRLTSVTITPTCTQTTVSRAQSCQCCCYRESQSMTAVRRDSDRGGTDEWRMDSPVCSSSGGDGTSHWC